MEKQPAKIFRTNNGDIRVHVLKTWVDMFQSVVNPDLERRKHLELRLHDRDYQVGDYLYLWEYNNEIKQYTDNTAWRYVTHIVSDLPHLTKNYIAMSIIEKIPEVESD